MAPLKHTPLAQILDSADWFFLWNDPAVIELPEVIRYHEMMLELEFFGEDRYRENHADLDGDSMPE